MKHSKLSDMDLSNFIEMGTRVHEDEQRKRGDFDSLPENHPFRIMMEESKKRYEAEQEQKKLQEEKRNTKKKTKKARKISTDEEKKKKEKLKKNVEIINKEINEMMNSIAKFGKKIEAMSGEFKGYPTPRVKMEKIKRMLQAVYKGLGDSQMNKNYFND